jgi:DNA-nicking Smr family endonuclease
MSKAVEDSIKKLISLGYSKSKAQKALKECGNNMQQARLCLERTKEAEDKKAHEAELAIKAHANAEAARKEAEERRKREELEPPPTDVGPNTRRHPCVSQYGACRYGHSCMFKELPWDTCINYLVGTCIYGDLCRNRHAVNGVDIRKIMNPDADREHEYVPLPNGDMVQMSRYGGKVQEGEIWVPEFKPEPIPAPLPDPSAFNPDAGSAPTYSEPLPQDGGHDIWGTGFIPVSDTSSGIVGYTLRPNVVTPVGSPNAAHPTPFLSKAKIGQNVPQPLVPKPITPQAAAQQPPQPRGPAQLSHPCFVQMGECRFGDRCMHADARGDVCVHWLNARCRHSADTCRYYHERIPFGGQPTQPRAGAAAAAAGFPAAPVSPPTHAAAAGASFGRTPDSSSPMFTGGSTVDSIWTDTSPFGSAATLGAAQHATRNPVDEDAWTKAFEPPTRGETARRTGDFIVSQMQHDVALRGSNVPVARDTGKWRGASASVMAAPTSPGSSTTNHPQADSTEEARAFEALTEVFPHVDPCIILQALRKCGNDRQLVAQVISESTPEHVEKAMQAATEEAMATTLSLVLVTLHSLLPSMEPAALEKILSDCNGDFSDAYRIAASTLEHIVASDATNRWASGTTKDAATGAATTYTPADTMKLDRLQGMFRELERFVIEKAFERSGRNTTDAIAILNHLNSDLKLVARETREEWGRQATTKPLGAAAAPTAHTNSPQSHPAVAPAPKNAKHPNSRPVHDASSFTVTSCDDDAAPAQPRLSTLELYKETKNEAAEHADWRRTRQEAYMTNAARAQVVGLAIQAYARQQHDVGKNLLRKSQELKRRYERLNMLAMHALERERSSQFGASAGASTLDLHGFHLQEALDVVARRIDLCLRKRVTKLRVIIGHGNHSKSGKSVVYPQVLAQLKAHPACVVKSILPAEIVVTIEPTH